MTILVIYQLRDLWHRIPYILIVTYDDNTEISYYDEILEEMTEEDTKIYYQYSDFY